MAEVEPRLKPCKISGNRSNALGKRVKIPIAKCPHCGFSVCDILNCPDLYDYCPHCGKKVNVGD